MAENDVKKLNGLVKILIVCVAVLIVLIVGIFVVPTVYNAVTYESRAKQIKESTAKLSEEVSKTTALTKKTNPLSTYSLGDFRVNTADNDQTHLIRVSIELAYDETASNITNELNMKTKTIKNSIINLLKSKEKSQLNETVAKERLKEEIIKAINSILSTGEIEDVYYTEFVIS